MTRLTGNEVASQDHLWVAATDNGRVIAEGTFGDGVSAQHVAATTNGAHVATWAGTGSSLTLWKIASRSVTAASPRLPFKILGGFFFLDDEHGLAWGGSTDGGRGCFAAVRLSSGKVVASVKVNDLRHALRTPAGLVLAIGIYVISAVDVTKAKAAWNRRISLGTRAVALSPDGTLMYVAKLDLDDNDHPDSIQMSATGDRIVVRSGTTAVLCAGDLTTLLGSVDGDSLLVPTGHAIVYSRFLKPGPTLVIADALDPERLFGISHASRASKQARASSQRWDRPGVAASVRGDVAIAFDKNGEVRLEVWRPTYKPMNYGHVAEERSPTRQRRRSNQRKRLPKQPFRWWRLGGSNP